jgi:hypothetical protein
VNKKIKKAIIHENIDKMIFLMAVIELHMNEGLLNLDNLLEKKYNPLTNFIFDCEETKVYESPLASKYVDFLISIGDDGIHTSVFEDVQDKCKSPHFSIIKQNIETRQGSDDEDTDED